jgi:hypothetical protein
LGVAEYGEPQERALKALLGVRVASSGLPVDVYDWEQDGAVAGEASRETGGGSGGVETAIAQSELRGA